MTCEALGWWWIRRGIRALSTEKCPLSINTVSILVEGSVAMLRVDGYGVPERFCARAEWYRILDDKALFGTDRKPPMSYFVAWNPLWDKGLRHYEAKEVHCLGKTGKASSRGWCQQLAVVWRHCPKVHCFIQCIRRPNNGWVYPPLLEVWSLCEFEKLWSPLGEAQGDARRRALLALLVAAL